MLAMHKIAQVILPPLSLSSGTRLCVRMSYLDYPCYL